MAIELQGEFSVLQDRGRVYAFLNDPQRLCQALPDVQSLEVQDADNYTVRMKVGVAHIRGLATVHVQRLEAVAPERAKFNLRGNVPGAALDLETAFQLAEDGPGCRVKWQGKALVGGTLASLAGGLLKGIAQKNIDSFIQGIKAGLGAQSA